MPLVSLQARKLGAGGNTAAGRPAHGAVRPHHGGAGAAEPGAQRHAGHGRRRHHDAAAGASRCAAARQRANTAHEGLAGVLGGRPRPRHFPEVAQQLFTPFFTTKAEGMGLGLSLCRTVVEQHGGFLGFEPNPPQGTIFKFTLPVEQGQSCPQPVPSDATRLNATVFIVDDDASVRDALAWLLRSRHLPSEVFASGEAFDRAGRTALCRASPAACCWTCACPA
jgi:hypothetical protein